ncbi:hypothetical protein [Lewinella sp. IMCC34183]|uniref:hypothetical protein n=1 Tax=Lewinella sp. IMCC34183 TaxID=2248762 RepID=UPI000E2307ED|nr:hypothetical protein [Lewinella sp. IMCC34183]
MRLLTRTIPLLVLVAVTAACTPEAPSVAPAPDSLTARNARIVLAQQTVAQIMDLYRATIVRPDYSYSPDTYAAKIAAGYRGTHFDIRENEIVVPVTKAVYTRRNRLTDLVEAANSLPDAIEQVERDSDVQIADFRASGSAEAIERLVENLYFRETLQILALKLSPGGISHAKWSWKCAAGVVGAALGGGLAGCRTGAFIGSFGGPASAGGGCAAGAALGAIGGALAGSSRYC